MQLILQTQLKPLALGLDHQHCHCTDSWPLKETFLALLHDAR